MRNVLRLTPGARVILACRDIAKAEAAVREIQKDTGNNNLAVYKLDLASLASVKECAKKIKAGESRLDILINNAGKLSTHCNIAQLR